MATWSNNRLGKAQRKKERKDLENAILFFTGASGRKVMSGASAARERRPHEGLDGHQGSRAPAVSLNWLDVLQIETWHNCSQVGPPDSLALQSRASPRWPE